MNRLFTAIACLSLLLVATAVPSFGDPVDLRDEPGWLPYRLRLIHSSSTKDLWEAGWGTARIYRDLDGDGLDDLIRANEYGISRVETRSLDEVEIWQTNFPPEFSGDGPAGTVDGIWDLDGDGRRQVLSTGSTPDGFRWLVRAMDLETGDIHSEYPLQGGEDLYADGRWDGKFRSFGVLDVPTPAGTRRGLVVAFMAGYDKLPRGVRVLDVAGGEVLWEFLAGPKIQSNTVEVVDIDADGRNEVVFLGTGVDNLGGRKINGTTDDHARLFVVNEDGSLLWSHRLGDAPAGGNLETYDFDGDGTREIAISGFIPEIQGQGVAIFRHDGTLWLAEEMGAAPRSMVPAAGFGKAPRLVVAVGPLVRRYAVTPEGLSLEREALFNGYAVVAAVVDVLGDAAPETIVNTQSDQVWILDADLNPQAFRFQPDMRFRRDNTFLVQRPDDSRRLITMGTRVKMQGHFDVLNNPRPVPWATLLSVGGVGGGALLAWRRRRKPKSKGTLRELRLQLLARLKLSGHGAIGALSSVRRIIWHLDTVQQGFEPDARVMNLFPDLSEDTLRVGLPNLQAAVELAELAQMDGDTVRASKKPVAKLAVLLEGLAGSGYDLDAMMAIREDLQAVAAEADRCFRELRGLVEDAFRADPAKVFDRSLAAHAADMEDLGVAADLDLSGAPLVQMDEEELAFIVDNLVENAVRAMHGSPERRLQVSWRDAGEHVALLVGDTGCGIAPDELELVMKPGHSKRRGGGLGLPRSREILGKYGGGLSVKESSPGRGTTLSLLVPAAPRQTEVS